MLWTCLGSVAPLQVRAGFRYKLKQRLLGKYEGATDAKTRLFMYLGQSASMQEGREMAFSVWLVRVVDGRFLCQKPKTENSDFILMCHHT